MASKPNCLQRLSASVNASFLSFFFNVGFRIAMNPLKWAGGVVLFAVICGMGWSQIKIEERPERLYTPQDSQSFGDRVWTEENFGFGPRMVSVTVVTNNPGEDNIITRENINMMFDLWEEMNELKVMHNGTEESFTSLCTKNPAKPAGQQCIRQSPLAFWGYNRKTFDDDTDILATVNKIGVDCCGMAPFIGLDRVFGSMNSMEQGNITQAGAMNMNFFLDQNRVAEKDGMSADDKKAMAWELEFAKLVRDDKNRNAAARANGVKFHPNTNANFDEAVSGTFAADGMLIFFSYMVITAYASFVLWKNNNVLSEASLGPLCVFCVGLAVVAGFGIVMIFKPFSLVVNSVIFVMLGIGVDDAFVILASIERAEEEGLEFESIDTAVAAFGPNSGSDSGSGSGSDHPASKLEPEVRAIVKKVAGGVALAGASISLTSLTDFVAFLTGATTVIPALSSFCIYASVTILFDFFMQCTLFVAFVTFKERSKQKNQRDCLTCCGSACCCSLCGPCVSSSPSGTTYMPCGKPATAQVNPSAKDGGGGGGGEEGYAKPAPAAKAKGKESFSKRLIGRKLPDLILNPVGKFAVFVLTVGLLAVGGIGCTRLRMEFLYDWFLPTDHWMADSFAAKKQHFTGVNLPFSVYTKEVQADGKDYWSERAELGSMIHELTENKWVLRGSVDSWQGAFHAWQSTQHNTSGTWLGSETSSAYHTDLAAFLAQPAGSRYVDDVKMKLSADGEKMSVVATRISALFVNPGGIDDQIAMMDDTRVVASKAGDFDCISYTYPMLFWEGLKIVNEETMRNVILAASMVFVVCLVVLADVVAAVIVLAVIVMIDVLLLGFIHWIGDYMNMVTAINLLLAIGLCVDYSAHICHAFLAATGTRDERARAALFHIGVPVFNGALTTLLATITLSMAQSYVFQVFFRMFMLIVCFGVYFGMVVLPVILSVVGPASHNEGTLSAKAKAKKGNDVEAAKYDADVEVEVVKVKSAQ